MLVGTKKLAVAIFGLLLAAGSVHADADGGGLRILAADTEGREETFGDIDAVQRRLRRLGTGDDESSSSSASSSSKGAARVPAVAAKDRAVVARDPAARVRRARVRRVLRAERSVASCIMPLV